MLEPGTQVGRFRVVRLIAQGGMAEVYRSWQELAGGIQRPAALKVIRPEYSESADFREMFLDEARTACTLAHPNIVHIYEVGESDGLLYMAMELVPGEPLSAVARALRERNERFSDEALIAIGQSTCAALEAVHALKLPGSGEVNLVHRDVSPHNLLLSSTGSLKLIDFGIAKAATNRNLTSPGVTKGKAGYFSPEQAMGKLLDGRSDLFSLGVTLYKLAAGVTPFDGHATHKDRNTALVSGRWEPLDKVAPGLLPGFYVVVDRALRLRKEDRWASATQMREALEEIAIDAGLHLGPRSLAGYVEENDGEISISKASRISVVTGRRGLTGERPTPVTAVKNAAPFLSTGKGRWTVAASAAAAAIVGFVAVLALHRPPPSPQILVVDAAEPIVRAPAPPQVPTASPPLAAVEVPQPVSPASSAGAADHVSRGHRDRVADREPRRAKVVPAKATVSSADADPPPVIPAGEGQLRVGANPDAEITIAGARRGETPLNLRLHSGAYTVEIARPGGGSKGRCLVKVFPDRTTRLRYDFKDDHCAVDSL